MTLHLIIILLCLFGGIQSDNLPTNYGYYTQGGIQSGLNADQRYFLLNGKNITLYSGSFHYFRVHKSQWRDRLRKMRAAGLNTLDTYVPWNLHEYQSGKFDFGNGRSDFGDFIDIGEFLKLAREEDLFVLMRPGPYMCGEWEFGGIPSFLLREKDIKLRTSDSLYLKYVKRYFDRLLPILARYQFTQGGSIIGFQVENEYANTDNNDKPYLRALVDLYKNNGITELYYTSDPTTKGTIGALPNEILIMANFESNPKSHLQQLDSYQINKPSMVMEYYSGWFDHFGENHHTLDVSKLQSDYEEILNYPASVNLYMFTGGTSFGFMSGANTVTKGTDNSGLEIDTTSYDYDSPISENGEVSQKFYTIKKLIEKYNPVKTALPELPSTPERIVFDNIEIKEQILLKEIIDDYPVKEQSKNITPMEFVDINNGSGQSFGYIVYRKTNLDIKANATLKIKGYIRDTVLLLVNGKLLTPVLSSGQDINGFGYWKVYNSSITLTEKDINNATLDLVVENNSRNNYGTLDTFQQFKGLTEEVLIDEQILTDWQIIPLEFKRSWLKELSKSQWHSIETKDATPALYRVTFNASVIADTYINVQDWRKGVAIINGFVLGRIFAIGPQQALYLPAGLLRPGHNELIIFEHFSAPDYVKFSKDPIYGVGTYIN